MWDFGRTERFEPEAIGEPGHRTFRVRALSKGEAASLWLEKEQLAALALAIRQLLEQTAAGDPSGDAEAPPPTGDFPEQTQVDFKIARLAIGYDEGNRVVVIFTYAEDAEEEDASPTFACQVTPSQCRAFAERAEEVIRAGRPVCSLCGGPIDREGHKCLRRNGHAVYPVPQE